MNHHQSHSEAESSSAPKGLFHAQNVQIYGGTFNSAGTQNNYYGEGNKVYKLPTYEQVESALKDVPNYRNIHGANLGKATKGTGPKFDEWKEYCEWLIPGGKMKAMWGTGMPGAGKTIFAAIALNTVEAHARASQEPICVAYIYFRYSDHTKATTHDLLEVLVKQTLERHPKCRSVAIEAYARHIQEKTRPSDEELLDLLHRFAEMMLITFYFLDAMDEAPPDVQLDLLEKLSSLNVQLFITSRPMALLQSQFPTFHQYPIRAQDHDLDLHITKEISRSVVLKRILSAHGSELQERVRATVKEKCGGMFLHASLQLDALRDCSSAYSVEKVLETFPPRIEDVYQQTWQRICDQSPENALIGRNSLLWVLCAERSLKIEELRHLVAACPETYKVDRRRIVDEQTLMTLCRGLVTVEEQTEIVRFVHYTAKDVVKELISKTNPHPHPHSITTQVCLELLVQHGFQQSEIDSDEALDRVMAHQPPLRYAYESWSFHARQSLKDDPAVARLSAFIQGCSSFPVAPQHRHGPREGWDYFQPLHVVSYFDLPPSLAGPASLQKPDLPSSKGGFMPLMLAVMRNSTARAEELLALPHLDVNSTSSDGRTALHLASYSGLEDVLRLVLSHPDINPNQVDRSGNAPLILATRHYDRNGAVRLLIAHPKINVNQADGMYYGWTPLMNVAYFGQQTATEVVELLLPHPMIEVNMVDKKGRSALILAAEEGNKGNVERLLDHPQIDINLVDNERWSALDYARRKSGWEDIVQILTSRSQTHSRGPEVAISAQLEVAPARVDMAPARVEAAPAPAKDPTARVSVRARVSRVFDRPSTFLRNLGGR